MRGYVIRLWQMPGMRGYVAYLRQTTGIRGFIFCLGRKWGYMVYFLNLYISPYTREAFLLHHPPIPVKHFVLHIST